jgi:glycosyltransferase involved in cell wall biosynthesis
MPRRSPLRIGLNLLYLRPGKVGGTETYARGLLSGLAGVAPEHQFIVFLNRSARDWPLPAGFERVVCSVSPRQSSRYLYEQVALPADLRRLDIDVVHSLAYVAPVLTPCASVVTVHDLNFREPSHRMPLVRRVALRSFVSAAVRSSDAVIVVSRFTGDELVAVMPDAAERLHVVHEAPMPESASVAREQLRWVGPDPYFIAFSSVSPNKNLERLVDAYTRLRAGGLRHSLILVGHPPAWSDPAVPGVVWTGYRSDAEVAGLLRSADALLFPSLYEGFGLPVLEAMQAGVAVACSRCAALPEVAGDAALYFDPRDVASIARAITQLAGDPALRASLVERGRARVASFSWERAARETLAAYDAALQKRAVGRPSSPD